MYEIIFKKLKINGALFNTLSCRKIKHLYFTHDNITIKANTAKEVTKTLKELEAICDVFDSHFFQVI